MNNSMDSRILNHDIKISVVMPVYNTEKYVKRCVESVLQQTYRNIELIIVDDCSPGNIKEIAQYFVNADSRVQIISHEKNKGLFRARLTGAEHATGEYIAFIDSDDVWKKSKIKEQIKFMQNNNYLLTHTSYNIVDKYNKIITTRKAVQKLSYENLLNSCDIGLSTVMINRKKVKKILFGSTRTKEDYSLWLTLSKQTAFYGLNKNLRISNTQNTQIRKNNLPN